MRASGPGVRVDDTKEIISMSGTDPLYGKVFLRLSGKYLFGAVRFSDLSAAGQFIEKLLKSQGNLQ
jgi:hypothetical protein